MLMEQSGKSKEEFLTILLNQVRCKKAHPLTKLASRYLFYFEYPKFSY